jgi:uncharacterized delta-60 repeat protein
VADDARYGVDPSFGDGGFVRIQPVDTLYNSHLPSATVDSEGRVILVSSEFFMTAGGPTRTHVRRLLADGSADLSFGVAGEVVLEPDFEGRGTNSTYTQVAVDLDDRIVLVRGPDADLRVRAEQEVSLRRLTVDGQIDAAFGVDGRASISATEQPDLHGRSPVIVDAAGNLVVAYTALGSGTPARSTVRLVRWTSAGQLDTTFGDGGFATLPATYANWPDAMAFDGEGRIVVGGGIDYDHDVPKGLVDPTILLARFLADGTFDPSFDSSAVDDPDSGTPKGEVLQEYFGNAWFSIASDGTIVAPAGDKLWRFGANGGQAVLVASGLQGGPGVPVGARGFLTWNVLLAGGDSGGLFTQFDPVTFAPLDPRISTPSKDADRIAFRQMIALPGGSVLAIGGDSPFSGTLVVRLTPGGLVEGPQLRTSIGDLKVGVRALTGSVTVTNTGTAADRVIARFFLSDDTVAGASDDALKSVRVGRIEAGGSKTVRFRVPLRRRLIVNGRFVLADAATSRGPLEPWRADNFASVGPIR